ncbi:MAG: regulatory iron-sulfur-containing complex subunit RicT [Gammaproteobacteria bacterium]|nr:regulatory iron-sulfur-containing complex subunit RicT [Gammaproteobacteria bacterium]MDE0248152.1 regulatory iron-sulfur-containing complex subunit RicT [Gammaproteobacteria bacterium]
MSRPGRAGAAHATFAEVGFKGTRRGYFTAASRDFTVGRHVIVEAERGEDLGEVHSLGRVAERKCASSGGCSTPLPDRKIVRLATEREVRTLRRHRREEDRVRAGTRETAASLGLRMKVSEAEWQFDRRKLTIYFTAERRVNFAELVRRLARRFRTRIELRQIGVRDEAALIGGIGRCGRELCCSTWLPELKPVSLQLAKDQSLSLNPAQISGCCGRLMCCLMYEHRTYVEARRRFPREGKTLRTAQGRERVLKVDIWGETVVLRGEGGERRTLALEALEREAEAASPGAPAGTRARPSGPGK